MTITNSAEVSPLVPSCNFHLWEPCNMRCGFCFATFQDVKQEMNLPKGHLPEENCILVVDRIAEFGFEKINFVGGEPTLCPWLPDLIVRAKGTSDDYFNCHERFTNYRSMAGQFERKP